MIKSNSQPNQKHPLSGFWPKPQPIASPRLSFFGKGITCIDRLNSDSLHAIIQLDLSHNALQKLDNIKQFQNLTILNISHNHITKGKQIAKVTRLKNLNTVLLKGNPFLKSQEELAEALPSLIPLNTDIQVLGQPQQAILQEANQQFTMLQVKSQYLKHVEFNISFEREFKVEVSGATRSLPVYRRMMMRKINEVTERTQCRKQTVYQILESSQPGQFQSRKQFNAFFQEAAQKFIEASRRQLAQIQREIAEKQQIYTQLAATIDKHRHLEEQLPVLTDTSNKGGKPLLQQQPLQIRKICSPQKESRLEGQNALMSEQKFESYYYNMMMKHNPVYHLLYSPLQSLKQREKDMLIETLSAHLKEKTWALMKMEKTKSQHLQLKAKHSQVQKQFKHAEQTFINYQSAMQQRLELMQDSNRQLQDQVNRLKIRLISAEQEKMSLVKAVEQLREVVSENRLQQITMNQKIRQGVSKDQNHDKIQQMRQKRLKRQTLLLIIKRSQRWSGFIANRQMRNKNSQVSILSAYFSHLDYNRKFCQFIRHFSNEKIYSDRKSNLALFIKNSSFQLLEHKLHSQLRSYRVTDFLGTLNWQRQQTSQKRKSIAKATQFWKKMIVSKVFSGWRNQAEESRLQDLEKEAIKYREEKIVKRSIRNWLIYVKEPLYMQAELTVDLKTNQMTKLLFLLQNNYFDSKQISLKSESLSLYLDSNRKIKEYFRFKTNTAIQAELRKNKSLRVARQLKAKYFYELAICSRGEREQRAQTDLKIRKIQAVAKSKVFPLLSTKGNISKYRKYRLGQIFWKRTAMNQQQILRKSLNEFIVQDRINCRRIRLFFNKLSSTNLSLYKQKIKKLSLLCVLKSLPGYSVKPFQQKQIFLRQLAKPVRDRRRLKEYLQKKYLQMMVNNFNQWRISIHQKQVEVLRKQIRDFGPQIEDINRRQKSSFEQKIILMNVIEEKEKTIRDCLKQLQEAEYVIQTKEQKYLKLKQCLSAQNQFQIYEKKPLQATFLEESSIPCRDAPNKFQSSAVFQKFRRF